MPFTESGLWLPREPSESRSWRQHLNLSLGISICGFVLALASFWMTVTNTYWTQRAYLTVTQGRVLRHTDEDGQVSFEVSLENRGATPAFIDEDAMTLFVLDDIDYLPERLGIFYSPEHLMDLGHHGNSLEVPAKGKAVLTTLLCFCLGATPRDNKVALFPHLVYHDIFGKTHYVRWGWKLDLHDAFVTEDLPNNIGAFKIEEVVDDDIVQEVFRKGVRKGMLR